MKWTREVNILVLELYFRGGRKRLSAKHSEVVRLSQLVEPFGISPSSINMALGNYQWLDTNGEHGLKQGGGMRIVWDEFSHNIDSLTRTAKLIENSLTHKHSLGNIEISQDLTELDDEEFLEGDTFVEQYLAKQRNSKAVTKKKQDARKQKNGRLICEVCDFDFVEIYGEIGSDFAECHHKIPLSETKEVRLTKTSDLAIVCANCHRMLHTARPVLAVEELRKIVIGRRLHRENQ